MRPQPSETRAEIEAYASRYIGLFEEIRAALDGLHEAGSIARAIEPSERTPNDFSRSEYPQYFVGDLDASFVLVHLNPKGSDKAPQKFLGPTQTFEEYFDSQRHFGARSYGPASGRRHKSPFDRKQIRFLRPFEVIEFVEENTKDDTDTNLERVIDQKLQLEFIPYSSPTFDARGFTGTLLRPHYERLMRVITARPRDYVIFCGAVFDP